jgi:hypothetical protein
VSAGEDGLLDRDYFPGLRLESKPTFSPADDIVFSNGQYVRWPDEGTP